MDCGLEFVRLQQQIGFRNNHVGDKSIYSVAQLFEESFVSTLNRGSERTIDGHGGWATHDGDHGDRCLDRRSGPVFDLVLGSFFHRAEDATRTTVDTSNAGRSLTLQTGSVGRPS